MSLSASDRAALRELSDAYAAGADNRDIACITALFAQDGVLVVPDPPHRLGPVEAHEGRSAIAQAMRALEATLSTVHVVATSSFEATTQGAKGRVRCVAHHIVPGREGPVDLVWFLHYDDHYARSDVGWVIARRAVTIDWIEKHRVVTSRGPATRSQQS